MVWDDRRETLPNRERLQRVFLLLLLLLLYIAMSAVASPSMSSSPATSSAVVLLAPGKSILKKAPPPPPPLFSLSRFTSKLLPPAPPPPADDDGRRALKRAHFILPQLATVYPISAALPPHTPTTQDERRAVEAREGERRRRVVRGNSVSYSITSNEEDAAAPAEEDDYWPMDKVHGFYRECCEGREDFPHPRISAAFKVCCSRHTR
jgi:protein phosphatase 1 regulatory subunit 37